MTVAALYEGWGRAQTRLAARLPLLSDEQLAVKGDGWPIWAIVAHMAGARVYWLCHVCGEPGAEQTPWVRVDAEGWEDRLDTPRGSAELLNVVETTWAIVRSCLERWTPDMLGVALTREWEGVVQHHTRQSILTRMVMHDSFHVGEISLLLGQQGLPSLDPWEVPPAPAEA